MQKTKQEFKDYLIKELNWPEKQANDWCNYLVLKGELKNG